MCWTDADDGHNRAQEGIDDDEDGNGGEGDDEDDINGDEASPSKSYPYDPTLRIDILSNMDLLIMARSWEYYILAVVGPGRTFQHPQLDAIVSELTVRGMLDQTNLA